MNSDPPHDFLKSYNILDPSIFSGPTSSPMFEEAWWRGGGGCNGFLGKISQICVMCSTALYNVPPLHPPPTLDLKIQCLRKGGEEQKVNGQMRGIDSSTPHFRLYNIEYLCSVHCLQWGGGQNFELILSSDQWLSYKTLPEGKNLIMVRNAGSMCITKTFYSEQYSTLQYNPRMYVTVLCLLSPHTYGISFFGEGGGERHRKRF